MLTLTGGSHHPGKLIQEEHCVLGLRAKAIEGLTLTGGSHHPSKLIQEEHCVTSPGKEGGGMEEIGKEGLAEAETVAVPCLCMHSGGYVIGWWCLHFAFHTLKILTFRSPFQQKMASQCPPV